MENGKRKAEGACCCLSELTAGWSSIPSRPVPRPRPVSDPLSPGGAGGASGAVVSAV